LASTLTVTQSATIKAIVNVFETGSALGDYGQVTVMAGDTGHLTFGRSQTTLGSGNLHRLLQQYCGNPGARFGRRLIPVLPKVEARDVSLDGDLKLHNVLRASADDPVMRDLQDTFFDKTYFDPAMKTAERAGIDTPLGRAVVYDSAVHGSWPLIRDRVDGTPETVGEREWIGRYVATRRNWLATHPRADLRRTVYRMDAMNRLIELGAWSLDLPLVVRGAEISSLTLSGTPPGTYIGPQPGTRPLAFVTSQNLTRGLDVRLLQLALSERGADVRADGVFGRASATSVADHQRSAGVPVTGVADPALVLTLASEVATVH
jgi:chitosanase